MSDKNRISQGGNLNSAATAAMVQKCDSTSVDEKVTEAKEGLAPESNNSGESICDKGERDGNSIIATVCQPEPNSAPNPEATSVPLDIDSANETEKSEPSVKHPVSPLALPGEMFCTTAPTISVASDMFAPDNLRIPQDFFEQAGTESIQGAIPVRKPRKEEFFRIRPGNEWQLSVAVIEEVEGMNKTFWVIHPSLLQKLSDEVSYVNLRLAVNRAGIPFLWPLKISRDGGSNSWNQSAMIAAEAATKNGVRIRPNCQVGQYDIIVAKNNSLEPVWPDMSFQEILESAFKGRIITDYNHPLLRQLRGEI